MFLCVCVCTHCMCMPRKTEQLTTSFDRMETLVSRVDTTDISNLQRRSSIIPRINTLTHHLKIIKLIRIEWEADDNQPQTLTAAVRTNGCEYHARRQRSSSSVLIRLKWKTLCNETAGCQARSLKRSMATLCTWRLWVRHASHLPRWCETSY